VPLGNIISRGFSTHFFCSTRFCLSPRRFSFRKWGPPLFLLVSKQILTHRKPHPFFLGGVGGGPPEKPFFFLFVWLSPCIEKQLWGPVPGKHFFSQNLFLRPSNPGPWFFWVNPALPGKKNFSPLGCFFFYGSLPSFLFFFKVIAPSFLSFHFPVGFWVSGGRVLCHFPFCFPLFQFSTFPPLFF